MTTTYTFDVFCSLDGFGSAGGDWTGYWGKQTPELLDYRLGLFAEPQRLVLGANSYRLFADFRSTIEEHPDAGDPWVTAMVNLPTTVVSTTLTAPLDWPDATIVNTDAVDAVAELKETSEVPLVSHGSLSLNHALMSAGLVDVVRVTLYPVITGETGTEPVFACGADFDLALLGSETLPGGVTVGNYRPTLHPQSR